MEIHIVNYSLTFFLTKIISLAGESNRARYRSARRGVNSGVASRTRHPHTVGVRDDGAQAGGGGHPAAVLSAERRVPQRGLHQS